MVHVTKIISSFQKVRAPLLEQTHLLLLMHARESCEVHVVVAVVVEAGA